MVRCVRRTQPTHPKQHTHNSHTPHTHTPHHTTRPGLCRPGLCRPGLSRPGLSRPSLSRTGLSRKKRLAQVGLGLCRSRPNELVVVAPPTKETVHPNARPPASASARSAAASPTSPRLQPSSSAVTYSSDSWW